MSHALRAHPDFPCAAVSSLTVDVVRRGSGLALTYVLAGALRDLAIPAIAAPARTDGLWRHACFEAFVRPTPGKGALGEGAPGYGYFELNLAPSTQWAAYRFTAYRAGMAQAAIAPPAIAVVASDQQLTLTADLDLAPLPEFAAAPWRLALAAVIEDRAGATSYWALAHPPGRPDSHHAAGFVLEL